MSQFYNYEIVWEKYGSWKVSVTPFDTSNKESDSEHDEEWAKMNKEYLEIKKWEFETLKSWILEE